MLKAYKGDIVDRKNKKVILRGVNLGGWLMMEGYILGGRNIAEREFKNKFKRHFGIAELKIFEKSFRENFITEEDFKTISKKGFNCIRVPFNGNLIKEEIGYLDKVLNWCQRQNIYCILDLHSAPGSQNPDWHSDSKGKTLLWKDKDFQEKTVEIWRFLADRYKEADFLAGYDLLNEPVCKDTKKILKIYKEITKAIREVDKNHMIFLEGGDYAQDLDFLGRPFGENLVYSIHFYWPLDFVFNFQRNLVYPGKISGVYWSKSKLKRVLLKYYKLKKRWKVPIYVGEFGMNSRCPYCHKEYLWLKDTLEIFEEFEFHWTYWTYKAVAGGSYPDGIFQYLDNPEWIKRQDLIFGWEKIYSLWKKRKREIIQSWQTKNFKENKSLSNLLSSF